MDRRAYFNEKASHWDSLFPDEIKLRLKEIVLGLSIRPGAKVLDVGTGTGILIPFLAEAVGSGGTVVAMDFAAQMLAVARQKYSWPNVQFQPGNYRGPLSEVLALPLRNNFQRAVFIASLNAVVRHLKLVEKTIHCRDKEPALCAGRLVEYVRERFGNPRIAFIGLQPAMVESLAAHFAIRVTDLAPDNIGRRRCGVLIEDAGRNEEVLSWGEIVLAAGSTAVNGTLQPLLCRKPVVFYGVTVAGVARLAGLEQYCYGGH